MSHGSSHPKETLAGLVDLVEDWSQLPVDPLVSVSMITYNHEKFIQEAVDSVLMQKCSFPYEIVIGEDKSTDATRAIVLEYQRRHPDKIRLRLSRENLFSQKRDPGTATHRACRGKYIALLEGDDYWTDPLKLQKQVDLLSRESSCTLCFHDALVVCEDDSKETHAFHFVARQPWFTIADLLEFNFISTCTVMVRREAIEPRPAWLQKTGNADWVLFVMAARHGRLGFLDEQMAVYRRHAASVWQTKQQTERLRLSMSTAILMRSVLTREQRTILEKTIFRWALEGIRICQEDPRQMGRRWLAWQALKRWPSNSQVSRRALLEALAGVG